MFVVNPSSRPSALINQTTKQILAKFLENKIKNSIKNNLINYVPKEIKIIVEIDFFVGAQQS